MFDKDLIVVELRTNHPIACTTILRLFRRGSVMRKAVLILFMPILILQIGCVGSVLDDAPVRDSSAANGIALETSDAESVASQENHIASDVLKEESEDLPSTVNVEQDYNAQCVGDFELGRFRPIFYDLPAPFVELVGTDSYMAWHSARSIDERENENVAVGFIRYFDISKEAFIEANERLSRIWENIGATPQDSSMFELYPVELIFTFDNELINEFFLWENSALVDERTWGNAEPSEQ